MVPAIAALAAPAAFAAERMWIGFHDDPSFRWAGDRTTRIESAASKGATLVLDSYGGAINDVAPDATAFVHRNVRFSVQILSYAGSLAAAKSRVASARAQIAPHGNGQAYQNYADPTLTNATRAYYGANHARLQSIKAAIDPDNRFRPKQGIRTP